VTRSSLDTAVVREDDDEVAPHVVRAAGAISGAGARDIRRAVGEIAVSDGGEIVIDLTEATDIDAAAIQEIGLAASVARMRGSKVQVRVGSPSLRERLLLAGIDTART
jgi:anti-anti-sigma regulatory factor